MNRLSRALLVALSCALISPVFADCVLRQSDAAEIALGPFVDSTDGFTAETALTISQADVRLKKCAAAGDCGAWGQVNETGAAAHEENGWYEKDIDTTDTNTVGTLYIAVNESGALPVFKECLVVETAIYDGLYADATTVIPANVVSVTNDALVAADFAADVTTELQAGLATSSALTTVGTNVSTLLEALVGLGAEQTADSGTTGTLVDAALTQASNDWFLGQGVYFTSGTLLGQSACIMGFTASSDTLAITTVTATVGTQTYYILPMAKCQTGDSFARLGAPVAASISADLQVVDTNVDDIETDTGTTLDDLVDDLESRLGTPSNLGGGATVAANLSDIEAQTDDIGAAGAGLTAITSVDIDQIEGVDATNQLDTHAAAGLDAAGVRAAVGLGSANLDTQLGAIDDFVDTEVAAILVDTGTTLDDLVDDLESRLGTPSNLGGGATVAGNLSDIEAQTDDIGTAGAGLTNIDLPNQTMDITGTLSGNVGGVATGGITNASFACTGGSFLILGVTDCGTAQSASSTGLVLRSAAAFADDVAIGTTLLVNGSTQGYAQSRGVTDNALSGDAFTVDTWPVTPSGTLTYYLFGTAPSSGGGGGGLDAAGVRSALGLASANLDTQLSTIDDFVDTEVAAILVDTGTTLDDLVDDLESRLGTPSNLGGGATVAGNLSDIEAQTDDIGAAGAGLTAADDAVMTRIGAPIAASISADIQVIDVNVDDIETDTSTTLDDLVDDLESRLGTPSNLGGGATVAANLSDIEGQTDDIGVAGVGLTNLNSVNIDQIESTDATDQLDTHASQGLDAAGVRAAVGLASANLDTQLTGIENGVDIDSIEGTDATDALDAHAAAGLDAAGVRAAVGLASANLDTQLTGIESGVDVDTFEGVDASNSLGVAQTGDSFARLGAPAGASLSADIAAIESQTDDIGSSGAGLTAADDAVITALGGVQSDTDNLQTRIPAVLVGGRIDATVDGTGMEAGAVTAIQSGLATAAALATVNGNVNDIEAYLNALLDGTASLLGCTFTISPTVPHISVASCTAP